MRLLANVTPTSEQLTIVSRNRLGIEIIRGSAGSGKTTTALLRLKSLIAMFRSRKKRLNDGSPIRVLVLTFNRTLSGYMRALAEEQVRLGENVELEVSTFASWAIRALSKDLGITINIIDNSMREYKINSLAKGIDLPERYAPEEVDYLLGRFLPENLGEYSTAVRTGRGRNPRVDRDVRETLLTQVVFPYLTWVKGQNKWDWSDLAIQMAAKRRLEPYDIIIADEAQDFSANELRAIKCHLADEYSFVAVLDTVQRIYSRGYTWKECGFTVRPEQTRRLKVNFRNTLEIAKLAASLVQDLDMDDDGSLPDFTSCERSGKLPYVLVGRFQQQLNWCLDYIKNEVDLEQESVVFLYPQGGGLFNRTKRELESSGLSFVELRKNSEWPRGPENIGISTMHSVKGLEFDHVIAIGLSQDMMEKELDDSDERMHTLRKLLAMAIGRAKQSVVLGSTLGEESRLIKYLEKESYKTIKL